MNKFEIEVINPKSPEVMVNMEHQDSQINLEYLTKEEIKENGISI